MTQTMMYVNSDGRQVCEILENEKPKC